MDYISREDAKTLLEFAVTDKWSLEYARKRFELDLPAADVIERDCVTINGYPVEYLTAVASLAVANIITPEIAIRQMADVKAVSKTIAESMKKIGEDVLRKIAGEANNE